MAPKKGVSFDDKRLRLLEIFARAEVFTLKEIERIGSKEKGIVEQTIKDVLQTLVDDGLVETDKIGAGNFYWALPSKAGNSRRSQLSKLQNDLQQKNAAISELEKRKRESESLRGDSGRASKIAEHATLNSNIKRLREEISKFSTCDPEIFAKLQRESKVSKAAADRWTDNLFLLQVRQFHIVSLKHRLTGLQSHVKSVGFSIEQFNQEFVRVTCIFKTLALKLIFRAFLTNWIMCSRALRMKIALLGELFTHPTQWICVVN